MNPNTLSSTLINQTLAFGASSAGIANIEDLKKMPSFRMMPLRPHIDRLGAVENETGLPEGVVAWPEGMKSVLVITYYHPEDDKYMDCWLDWKNPPGNVKLAKINKQLKAWLEEHVPEITAIPMGYYVESTTSSSRRASARVCASARCTSARTFPPPAPSIGIRAQSARLRAARTVRSRPLPRRFMTAPTTKVWKSSPAAPAATTFAAVTCRWASTKPTKKKARSKFLATAPSIPS